MCSVSTLRSGPGTSPRCSPASLRTPRCHSKASRSVGPYAGRDAIAEAYARRPPDDEVVLLGTPREDGDVVDSDYAWANDGERAGRMIVTTKDGLITRLVVTFE